MKSVVIEKPGVMRQVESHCRPPSEGEVVIQVEYAGICGSDMHIYHGANPFAVYPRIVGHEFVGRITVTGPGVDSGGIGQRVVVDPVISCGHCYPCSIGRPNVCETLTVLGVHRDGGFSEFVCVPYENAWAVPDSIPATLAVTIEPYAVAANVTQRTGVNDTDVALVYGAGPVGMAVIDVLCNVRNVPVIVVDHKDDRLDKAKQLGARVVINNSRELLRDILQRRQLTPTLIIDAVCHPSILEEAVTIISPAGRIGLLGFSAIPSAVSQQALTRRELTICSSRLNCRKFPQVIDWFEKKRLHPDVIISHIFPIDKVADAFSLIASQPEGLGKVLLEFPCIE